MKLTVHVDGGARGNPGPAAIAAVVSDPDGEVIDSVSQVIGRATNNVAEYRALILGVERAAELGATEVDVVGDSELIVKQVRGEYKVKNPDMKPLHAAASAALARLDSWSIRHVKRELNAEADRLVNEALDAN
ncbi:MAG TPA: ribonuclease HI family protein [Solirubrobacterales bacterium]|nr:ribonuclease HI family protein [Solirubrobacterales bacterium]